MLASGTTGPIGILPDFRLGNIDDDLILNLWRYINGRKTRLSLAL